MNISDKSGEDIMHAHNLARAFLCKNTMDSAVGEVYNKYDCKRFHKRACPHVSPGTRLACGREDVFDCRKC